MPAKMAGKSIKRNCTSSVELYTGSSVFGTNRWDYNIRIFPLQVSLTCVLSLIIQLLLKPFGETPVVGHIMAGLIIGKSGLRQLDTYQNFVFPTLGGTFIVETLGNFGGMIYIFLMGVKMDLSVLMRSSKIERIIGISTFVLPHLLNVPLSIYIEGLSPSIAKTFNTDSESIKGVKLFGCAILSSTSSFHVISCFLTDLKILNTELGRIASSASTISGMCSWVHLIFVYALSDNTTLESIKWVKFIGCAVAQVIFITMVLRQIVIWMIKQTRQGERVKDIYIFIIYLMVLGTGLTGEICGQHFIFGPMILGLAIPNGPPMGSALADKLDAITSALLVPLYFCFIGNKVDATLPQNYHWCLVIIFCMVAFLGKLIATLIPCLFYEISLEDAFMLGLSLSALGIVDVHNYRVAFASQVIGIEPFSIMVIFAMCLVGVISPIVHFFYDPSKRYIINKKRTIQHLKPNAELRILVCTYNDENVPTLVNMLEASNPTQQSPIIVYLLHLVELIGRSTQLLIAHKPQDIFLNDPTPSDRIINGFRIFEKKYQGAILLQPFTSMTPLLSAEEDICRLAFDKRACFVIIPFHKKWNIDGTTQSNKWRNTNKRVLKQAPCSIGILIDRGALNGARSVLSTWSTYKIGVIFLGDGDDREALCYAIRMATNPNVLLTVYRIIVIDYMTEDVTENMLDENMINEYRIHHKDVERNTYKEEIVKDGIGIISVLRNMENSYDLVLVGRNHTSYYNIFSDFIEWQEYPELGFFGDMLASSDFKGNASILIIQQHSSLPTYEMRNEADHSYTTNTWK